MQRIKDSHSTMVKTYESKLAEYGIPPEVWVVAERLKNGGRSWVSCLPWGDGLRWLHFEALRKKSFLAVSLGMTVSQLENCGGAWIWESCGCL